MKVLEDGLALAPRYAPPRPPALRSLLSNSNRVRPLLRRGRGRRRRRRDRRRHILHVLDMASFVCPPDQCDDAANAPQQKQESQWIEPIGFAIPAMSSASHTNLLFSQLPVLVRDHIEMRARPSPGKPSRHARSNQESGARFRRFAEPVVILDGLDSFRSRAEICRRNSSFSISA